MARSYPPVHRRLDRQLTVNLAIGYPVLGRLCGSTDTGGGGTGSNSSSGGMTGLTRMFGTAFGSQFPWLIPAALIGLVADPCSPAGRRGMRNRNCVAHFDRPGGASPFVVDWLS